NLLFFFNAAATTVIYTLSLHDALPILLVDRDAVDLRRQELAMPRSVGASDFELSANLKRHASECLRSVGQAREFRSYLVEARGRSEEHTSELQSPCNLVCRLLLEKKKA